jgi:deoxyribonuclease V
MLACVDVSYDETKALAGCLLFSDWRAAEASQSHVVTVPLAAAYRPGEFYLRELPPLLALLASVVAPIGVIVVDGYVWLGAGHAGLGAKLYAALEERVPIVGVAKKAWGGEPAPEGHPERTIAVSRGGSTRALFVTAAGMDVAEAASRVVEMHGDHRLPTLLKAVDLLVRRSA